MMEQWKSIPGYEGLYEASDQGQIRSLTYKQERGMTRHGRILKQMTHPTGYKIAALSKNGKAISKRVHRLIMLTFVGKSDHEVNHKDGVKPNNSLSNLEYVTALENTRHAIATGLSKQFGEDGHAKLTNSQAIEVKELLKSSEIPQAAIARTYNVQQSCIYSINQGKSWEWLGDYTYPIRTWSFRKSESQGVSIGKEAA